ncbi:hypothetical protein ACFC06_10795 [Nocardia sp. NPDC056064]|uniref:hypothetical protein n=1 Tax=Nocardia sp. NPDC056064 TaxID=3345701 RepID=UPI0035DF9235
MTGKRWWRSGAGDRDRSPAGRGDGRDTQAERSFYLELAQWQTEQDRLDTLVAVARRVSRGGGGTDYGVVLKSGETALFADTCRLIEPRKQRGHSSGSSSGVSVRIARGVWYRTGSYRGTYVPGPELQTSVDFGQAVITTSRVIFTGGKTTREWRFDKLVVIAIEGDAVLIHVENRQKVSGVVLGRGSAEFHVYLDLAVAAAQRGIDSVASELKAAADAHMARQPRQYGRY